TRRQGSWSGARLHHSLLGLRCPPSALYTFPARLRGLGSASARVRKPLRAFPEFDGLHPEDFSPGAQVVSSESAASTNSATRASSAHPCPNRTASIEPRGREGYGKYGGALRPFAALAHLSNREPPGRDRSFRGVAGARPRRRGPPPGGACLG